MRHSGVILQDSTPFLKGFSMFGISFEHLLIVGVVLLLFGGAKIPQLMRGLGRGVGELKVGLEEGKKAFTDASSEDKKDDDAEEGEIVDDKKEDK
jgi:sec-independent protein translocase protein TatA